MTIPALLRLLKLLRALCNPLVSLDFFDAVIPLRSRSVRTYLLKLAMRTLRTYRTSEPKTSLRLVEFKSSLWVRNRVLGLRRTPNRDV